MNKRVFIPAVALMAASFALSGTALAAGVGNAGFVLTARIGQPSMRDMVIEPGSDPGSLQLHFAGAESVRQSAGGMLDIVNNDGYVWHYRPQAYQVVNGKWRPLVVGYHVIDKDHVSLKVENFNPSAAIVVGPVSAPKM